METEPYSLLDDYHLLSYDVLDSTNQEARRCAGSGAQHGAVIWAKRQTNGKGRMGREWVSPEGNLYLSILLAPECSVADASQLSFVAAVAAVDALAPIIPHQGHLSCKWPNDILYQGKKIGGILLESFTTIEEEGVEKQWAIVGVGINVENYPQNVRYPAISLHETGIELISAKIVLSRYIHSFIERYDLWKSKKFSVIRDIWTDAAFRLGERVTMRVGDELFHGDFNGIDEHGCILLQTSQKQIALNAGEIIFSEKEKSDATCD